VIIRYLESILKKRYKILNIFYNDEGDNITKRRFKVSKQGKNYVIHDKATRKRYNIDNTYNRYFENEHMSEEY
jgi:hypothetical protein